MMNLLFSIQKWRNSRLWINILWLKMVINNEPYWMPPQLFNPFKTPTIRVSLKNHILHTCSWWKKVYWLLKYTVHMTILKTSEIILYKHCFYYSLFVKDTLKFVSNQSYYARCSFFKQVHLICRIGSADYCGMFSYLQLKSKFYNSKGNIQLIFHTGKHCLMF